MSNNEFYMSQYMARIDMNLPEKVWIFDTTLRDGEQMPSVTYTIDEKIQIARQLDELGVPKIEAGFPITSPGETEAVRDCWPWIRFHYLCSSTTFEDGY